MTDYNSNEICGIFKEIASEIRYYFLSNEAKFEFNLKQLKEKYWFEQMLKVSTINRLIEEDKEIRVYLTSRKNVRSLLRDKYERKKFKEWVEYKSNESG